MPVTYVTMLIATLAIAGIPPFSGFFSKDEILYRTFLASGPIWVIAVITAFLTAFYMFRLMAMTFYGGYRGPAWQSERGIDRGMASSGPDDAGAHGPAGPHGRGHGAWHGPHESPRVMTVPLMALAAGAVVAGFVGVPAALGGGNAIEHFLEPSFTATAAAHSVVIEEGGSAGTEAGGEGEAEGTHLTRSAELGLMLLSVVLAVGGIALARRNYVTRPQAAEDLARRFPVAHRVLLQKYYVDELYGATFVRGTLEGARGLWGFDRRVVDGAVDGSGWLTRVSAWISGMLDKYVVDGLVNLVGWMTGESSYVLRRVQTGLIQNYALVMLIGVFAFLTLYLFIR